jgi:HNH endonuclease
MTLETSSARNYLLAVDSTVELINKIALLRTESLQTSPRRQVYRTSARKRWTLCDYKEDNVGARFGLWDAFEATHIFPLPYEHHWNANKFDRWITLPPGSGGRINSVQNRMLLRRDMCTFFKRFNISINPDFGFFSYCSFLFLF